MTRVFVSAGTGASIYVFANDHCPPHAHARHRGEEWIARVAFSYLNTNVSLMSIAPLKNMPGQRVISRLLEDIQAKLSSCRHHWWLTMQTTCLVNQWSFVTAPGAIDLLPKPTQGAKQILDAVYDSATENLQVSFADGSIIDVRTRS